MGYRGCLIVLAVLLQILPANAQQAGGERPAGAPPRYTFSWPLVEGDALKPRGGMTRGAPVTLDNTPSPAWRALQQPGLAAFERDRRAILAMAGDYRVSFDFLEIEAYAPAAKRDPPYQSWGTERVYVDRDDGRHISLVHILEMRFLDEQGAVSEPVVTKHWRQDWQYEPEELVEFSGREQWQRRKLARDERSGRWSQTVYQVDESPRYAAVGRWEHSASFSTWMSAETWRPLPRREWSIRKDYQVLVGTNRHTVTATGWTQEENNLKTVLTGARQPDPQQPYLAREYGVARYERLRDADFAAADRYFEKTRRFWNEVLAAWHTAFAKNARITLNAPSDQSGSFMRVYEYAEQLAGAPPPAEPAHAVINDALHKMGVPP